MSMLDLIDKEKPMEVVGALTVAALVFPMLRAGQIMVNATAGRSLYHMKDEDLAAAILDYAAEFDTIGAVAKYRDLLIQETEH